MIKRNEGMEPQPFTAPPKTTKGQWVLMVVVVLLLALAGYAVWQRNANRSAKEVNSISKQEDVSTLVGKIARHLTVNDKETPLVAIVTDVKAAKEQSPVFYAKAQNGDRLAVWSDKAVLYSPERDEVESVLVFQTTSTASTAALAAERATVEIRNGSGVVGLSGPLAEKLRALGLNVIKTTTTRVKQVYPTTLVMKTGSRVLPASAQVLASYGSAVASTTVPGEAPVSADFLIILGKNDVATYQDQIQK